MQPWNEMALVKLCRRKMGFWKFDGDTCVFFRRTGRNQNKMLLWFLLAAPLCRVPYFYFNLSPQKAASHNHGNWISSFSPRQEMAFSLHFCQLNSQTYQSPPSELLMNKRWEFYKVIKMQSWTKTLFCCCWLVGFFKSGHRTLAFICVGECSTDEL